MFKIPNNVIYLHTVNILPDAYARCFNPANFNNQCFSSQPGNYNLVQLVNLQKKDKTSTGHVDIFHHRCSHQPYHVYGI